MRLIKFLVKAKINTYASRGEGGEKVLPDGSKEFEFREGEFKYRDRYFGFNPFIGEEMVLKNTKAVWGMNYYGGTISETVPAKSIYQFLQKALREISELKPFRGPKKFIEGDFEYFNNSEGILERFKGSEKIFYKKQEVYTSDYHGGLMKAKIFKDAEEFRKKYK